MYEHPTVTQVGKVADVVLGIAAWGRDIDESLIVGDFEFCQDDMDDNEG